MHKKNLDSVIVKSPNVTIKPPEKRSSSLVTLPEKRFDFNTKVQVSHTGGELSTDTGLVLVKEMMTQLDFTALAQQLVHFKDERRYYRHTNVSLLEQVILQLIAGYYTDLAANQLRIDPIFKLLLAKSSLASQASLSRFWRRCDDQTITSLQALNQAMLDKVRLAANQTELIIDIDSTHADTYGHQEQTDFNAHYGTMGYHPLVAFDGQNGHCLKAQLRPGNVYTSSEVDPFLTPLLEHYRQSLPCTEVVVGFATPELYATCEANHAFYLIRLKVNRKLSQLAENLIQIDDGQCWEKTETHYYATTYQAKSWPVPRQIYIKSTRPAGELLFEHEYLVTNFTSLSAEAAFTLYRQRGEMENYIKEIKAGFYFDKTDSSRFSDNHARMMLSVLAYNLVSFMKRLALPERHRGLQINTIRLWLFKIAGKLVHSGRKIQLKLSTYHVHQALFYQLLAKIQSIQWQGLYAQR